MKYSKLADSDLIVSKLGLGTMTFGEQVTEIDSFNIMNSALNCGINFFDTAEMYPIPQSQEKFGLSEKIIGNWFNRNKSIRHKIILSTKISGPSKSLYWIRQGKYIKSEDFEIACNDSLSRLQTDYIDLYQIHWPVRHVQMFGQIYFDRSQDENNLISIFSQLEALDKLIKSGKIRYIGLSNETPFGLHEFINIAKQFGFSNIVSIQNSYSLLNRSIENALDESLFRFNIPLIAYSPLAYGLLTGKYDSFDLTNPISFSDYRIFKFDYIRRQRWGNELSIRVAKIYNSFAREIGLSPSNFALAFCLNRPQVASTLLGLTSVGQLNENIKALDINLDSKSLEFINDIRFIYRDLVQ